jgi:hypothetical protein
VEAAAESRSEYERAVVSEHFHELETAAVHKSEAVAVSVQCFEAETLVESKSELAGESVLRCELEAAAEGMPAAVPTQELASVFAYKPEVVESSAQDSAQRLELGSGAASRSAAVEEHGVEGPHPWTVSVTKAGELSRLHSQAVSMAVAAVVIAVVVEPAILAVAAASAVAAVRARYALVARDFAAAVGESERPALQCTIEAVARLWRQAQKPWAHRSQTPAARLVRQCCPESRNQRQDLANAGRMDLRSRRPGLWLERWTLSP